MSSIPGGAPLITQAIAGTTQSARVAASENDEKDKRAASVRRSVRDEVRITATEEPSAVRAEDDADPHEQDRRKPTHHGRPQRPGDDESSGGHLDLSA